MNVVAAIIKKNQTYLIVKRNKNKHLGLKWEFPGGKVEKNENFLNALLREIKEELNISINIGRKISQEKYKDKMIDIILHYYECQHISGKISLNEHEDMKWVKKENLHRYDMAEADNRVIKKIK